MSNDILEKLNSIRALMDFAVPEEKMVEALDLLEIYSEDKIGLDVLHEFYSYLPEGKDDWIREIRLIGRQKGMFLLACITGLTCYIYLVSSEGIEFHGSFEEGIWDKEVLDFFGIENPKDRKGLDGPEKLYPIYEPIGRDAEICPACHAATGEFHELGCPVELCPWCGGQFVYCNCRFDKLELDTLSGEAELIKLEELLSEKGRIPYAPEQRPSFLDTDELQ